MLAGFRAYAYTTNQGKRSTRYDSRCRHCARALREKLRARDPEHAKATHSAWKSRNVEHLKAYNKSRQADPEHRKLKAFHQRLRKARVRSATIADTAEIRTVYAEAIRLEAIIAPCPVFDLPELGRKLHVDHIVPLKGRNVCGLHVAHNLQILPIGLNMRKGISCPR